MGWGRGDEGEKHWRKVLERARKRVGESSVIKVTRPFQGCLVSNTNGCIEIEE